MAAIDRKPSNDTVEKGPESETKSGEILPAAGDDRTQLHRGLKARHVTMIAIGGAIGTGLIIGTGSGLARAGPASVLISYSMVGFLVYLVMCALGEMASWLPLGSGFTGYATRFCDPALGFSMGYTYWFKYIILSPNQLTAAALVLQYWCPAEKVNPGVWIAVFLVLIVAINYLGVKFFGEFEFWLSSFKVIVIIGLIILSLVLVLGGGPDHDRKGFRYWHHPGAFHEYIETGSTGRFLAFWATMVQATFAFLGTELIGVTVGETQNPRRNIPRAIKLTFWRIVVFYIVTVLLLGMLVPYDSPELIFASKKSNSAAASPFVVAIKLSGVKVLPGIMNACILLFVISAANSDLYIASRTLYGLASEAKAPRIFAYTNNAGVPVYSLGLSASIALLAFMNVSSDAKVIFGYFVNLVSIFGLLTWISILVSHIYFVRARNAQGVQDHELAYKAPFGKWGSYGALAFCILIAIFKNFNVFVHNPSTYGNFDYKNFITGYLGIPLYLIMILGYKVLMKSPGVKPESADIWSGKAAIDAEEQEFLAQEAAQRGQETRAQKWYRYTLGWLF
ncbi:putative dicarboxylic amino acid permease [Xylona heveae TC161]|uniref:Putative dicarboxylic amino acid permease n=1 Tax=Xylona heveae (strain CBS 132557 / TC161) TaxID=1328760 RepID=A0A165H497_XYLHT|nr:putative dicarboxylic amino acid permease [Xylona heveae TC161]KZF22965.1 putative dicarboxylic amino acid permease [Xylona heveae TC161]